jgi:hypothetical protein
MNKKILYGIFFVSIFLLSTAASVRSVQGYTWGVPKQAIGVTGESEISIYDEDAWEDHLGKGSSPKDFKDGDVDEVGAKSKSTYTKMETDEDLIDFEEVYVFEAADLPNLHEKASGTLHSLADSTLATPGPYGPLGYFFELAAGGVAGGVTGLPAASNLTLYNTYLAIAGAVDGMNTSLSTYDTLVDLYTNSYDGSILTRELWDPTIDEYKDKPDEKKDEVPFLADPRDWYESWRNVRAAQAHILQDCDDIVNPWTAWYLSFYDLPGPLMSAANKWPAYQALNGSIKQTIQALHYVYAQITLEQMNTIFSYINISNIVGVEGIGAVSLQEDYVAGAMGLLEVIIETTRQAFVDGIPDKLGYLMQLLEAGLPCYVPQTDYMAKVIELFDIQDDKLYKIAYIQYGDDLDGDDSVLGVQIGSKAPVSGAPLGGGYPTGGDTVYVWAEVDVEWDGSAVVIEINYQDDQYDPKDILEGESDPDELEDWEWVFPYGDTGTQGAVQLKDGNEVFWESKGIEQIPGFEVSIILGASALSIIGLIYVIMKKRKM